MNKVWTYLSNRPFSDEEEAELLREGKNFVSSWTAHEMQLKASFSIFRHHIIVVTVDESLHNASGCSIDKLLRFVKACESKYQVQLLNRLLVAFDLNNQIQVYKASDVKSLLVQGAITSQTNVFNLAVTNELELQNWQQPLQQTWLSKYL